MKKWNVSIKGFLVLMSLSFFLYAAPKNWTGLYGGFNTGGILNHANVDANQLGLINMDGTCHASTNFSSFFPGLQVGYARQLDSKWVLGVEGDFTYNVDNDGIADCECAFHADFVDQFDIKNRIQGSLRGRIGYSLQNNLLPFVVGGASFADLGISYNNEVDDHYSKNTTGVGWLVGAGIEWGMWQNWSLRAEYFYVDYGNALTMDIPTIYGLNDPNGKVKANLYANNVQIAMNYWFG